MNVSAHDQARRHPFDRVEHCVASEVTAAGLVHMPMRRGVAYEYALFRASGQHRLRFVLL
jgi:hypothetical protein